MKWPRHSLEDIQKARTEIAERRRHLLELQKNQKLQAKETPSPAAHDNPPPRQTGPFDKIDINAALTGVQAMRLMALDLEVGPPTVLNRPTLALLHEFFHTLKSRESVVLLQWPFGQRDISLLHPLAMLAVLSAPAQRTTRNLTWCDEAPDFRTLYFPWRGGATSAVQSSYLVGREEILDRNKLHLTRRRVNGSGDKLTGTDMLHLTLGHLNRLSQLDTTKPHLAHPTLAEIYPTFVAEGGENPPSPFGSVASELFGRLRYGAALDRMTDYRPQLSVPATAPFGFYGVSSRAEPRRALAARALVQSGSRSGRPPDICILDLGPPGLNRLGPNWNQVVEDFILEARKRFPDAPFLVVTQDPYVHGRMNAMLRSALKTKSIRSRVLVRISRDPVSNDPATDSVSDFSVQFSTTAGPTADAIAALSEAARGSSDPAFAGGLRREMGSLRKAASLPCGLAQAYDFLCGEIGQSAAETFLEYRSRGTLLAPLDEALKSEIGGTERTRLQVAHDAVDRAFNTLDAETPIGSLFSKLAATLSRKSSRTIIAFASNTDRLLGRHRLVNDPDAGTALARHLDNGHLRLASMDDLEPCLADIEQMRDRNSWKRLVLVAPALDWLSTIAARPWLPEELIVVCERNFAARVADSFRRLSSHPDLGGAQKIGGRLSQIAAAAKAEIEARQAASIDLDLEPSAGSAADDSIIDLTDDDSEDGTGKIIITLASDRQIHARPGSTIIRYNKGADINPFERTSARQVGKGEAIVVPDGAFLGEAREILPVRVLAQSWVDVYHAIVTAQLSTVPGDSLNAKARYVLAGIGKRGAQTQTQGAVLDWLKVEEYSKVEAELRRPHAPQRRRDFDAFMSVLGINEELGEKMWVEGIQPLRIDRRRAGYRMAQAFVSVLVDPHGTASGFDETVRSAIAALRQKALDYLDQVVNLETTENEGAP